MHEKKQGNWFGRHKILTVIGVLIILAIIGGAANSKTNTTSVNTTASTSQQSSSSIQSKSKTPAQTAHVGSTLTIAGDKGLAVILSQIVDPAQGADEYTTADAGKRFVAAKLQITNNGSGSYNDDANNNVTLIGSDNQSYTATFENIAGCTNFNSGQYTLPTGQSATGCVVFQVPNGVTTSKVQFQTQSGLDQTTGQWIVP